MKETFIEEFLVATEDSPNTSQLSVSDDPPRSHNFTRRPQLLCPFIEGGRCDWLYRSPSCHFQGQSLLSQSQGAGLGIPSPGLVLLSYGDHTHFHHHHQYPIHLSPWESIDL